MLDKAHATYVASKGELRDIFSRQDAMQLKHT